MDKIENNVMTNDSTEGQNNNSLGVTQEMARGTEKKKRDRALDKTTTAILCMMLCLAAIAVVFGSGLIHL